MYHRLPAALAAVAIVLAAGAQPARAAETLSALCASTTTAAMTEIIPLYAKAHPDVTVQPVFGGAQVLRAQVEGGNGGDLVVVGHGTIVALSARLDPPTPLFSYHEAVLVPKGSGKVKALRDLENAGVRIAIGTTDAPHGNYAREVLKKASSAYGADFEKKVLANVVVTKASAIGIPQAVAAGAVDAGIGFSSDLSDKVGIVPVPPQFDVVTVTSGGALKGGAHEAAARAFIAYLAGPEAQAIFRKHHFDAP